MAGIITMGNALVDVMTLLESDDILKELKIPKASMELVDHEKSTNILKLTKHLEKSMSCGGSAANTARSLANMGIKTAYIGKIGKDETGAFFRKDTENSGVRPLMFESQTPTGTSVVMVSKDSERTFATYLGAAAEMSPEEITPELFEGYDILHIEGYLVFNNELIEKAVITAKKTGLRISLDLASYNVVEANTDFLKNIILNYVDIVFANEEEAKAFTGKEPLNALDDIAKITDIAVVKVGEKGSFVKSGNYYHQQPSLCVKPVDTTGAGDYYAAGFLYGLAKNWNFDKCTMTGTLLAGNVIETIGTKLHAEIWKKINSKVIEIEQLKSFLR